MLHALIIQMYCSLSLSLVETSVQQDSKQVQVDLQDMGYETCGRSENEAEREETSSPGTITIDATNASIFFLH